MKNKPYLALLITFITIIFFAVFAWALQPVAERNIFYKIAYYPIWGKPLIMYSGLTTLLSFIFTATIAIMNKNGIRTIPFLWHKKIAIISIFFGIMHGILGLLSNF